MEISIKMRASINVVSHVSPKIPKRNNKGTYGVAIYLLTL